MRRHLAIVVSAVLAVTAAAAEHPASVRKEGDAVEVAVVEGRTRVGITSGSGIGGAKVALTAGDWGRPLVVEFKYRDGRGFKMLEQLVLTSARLKISGKVDDSGRMAFYWADAAGKSPGELEMSGYVRVQVEVLPGALRVVFPANMHERAAEVEIEWIDAFR